MFRSLSLSLFAGMRGPVDLVHGSRTFRAVRESIGRFRRLWPQARVFELKGLGHLPMVRGAREVAGIIFS